MIQDSDWPETIKEAEMKREDSITAARIAESKEKLNITMFKNELEEQKEIENETKNDIMKAIGKSLMHKIQHDAENKALRNKKR
jgi:hypothetical protein